MMEISNVCSSKHCEIFLLLKVCWTLQENSLHVYEKIAVTKTSSSYAVALS